MKKFEVKTKKTIYQVMARDSQHAKQKVLHIANRPMKDEDSTSDGKLVVGKTYIDEQGKKWICKSISMGGFMVSFDNADPNDQEASRSIIGYTPDSLEETWGLKLADRKVKDGRFRGEPYKDEDVDHCANYLWTWCEAPYEYYFETPEELEDFYAKLKVVVNKKLEEGYNSHKEFNVK